MAGNQRPFHWGRSEAQRVEIGGSESRKGSPLTVLRGSPGCAILRYRDISPELVRAFGASASAIKEFAVRRVVT